MSRLYLNKIQHFILLSILFHFSLIVIGASFGTLNKKQYAFEVFLLNESKTPVKKSSKRINFSSVSSNRLLKQSSSTREVSSQSLTVQSLSNSEISLQEISSSGKGHSEQKEGTMHVMQSGGGNQIIDTDFGSINGPRFLHREIPVYPQIARRLGKEGKVILRLTINENGEVVNIEIIESAPYGFTESAVDAVKKSRFSPAMKDGRPVACRAILPIRFILKN